MARTYRDMLDEARGAARGVSLDEVKRRLDAGEAMVLVDVREVDEWRAGHLPGAVSLPRGLLEMRAGEALRDPSAPLVVYCASGARAALAARTLRELGYERVERAEPGFARWRELGLPVEAPPRLSDAQRERYARHLLLPEVGEAGQAKLVASKVLVLGAGGLGSPAAIYLAAAGVGTIGIVDHDAVDASNLQRQIVHTTARVGRPKVESAARALAELNPEVRVVPVNERLDASNVDRLFAGYDLVVDGCDNFPTRYLANDAGVLLGKPVVHGSVHRFEGRVTLFDPARGGPCYRCLFPAPPPRHLAPSCQEAGVLGVLPGIIGTLQAAEALKYLLGVGEPLVGRLLTYDARAARAHVARFDRDPACPACGDAPTIRAYVDYEDFCDRGDAGATNLAGARPGALLCGRHDASGPPSAAPKAAPLPHGPGPPPGPHRRPPAGSNGAARARRPREVNVVAWKGRPTKKGNVIFVAFGAGGAGAGANAGGAAAAHAPPPPPAPPPPMPEAAEGVTAFFTAAEAARLCGVTRAQLRSLDRAGIAPPTGLRAGKRYYTFRDLIVLRAVGGLLARRVRTTELAAAVRALRQALPEGAAPLSRLRIVSDGKRILVRDGTGPYEAVTGQTVLDFEVRTLRDDVVRMLRPADTGRRVHEAYELYVRASALDEAPETLGEAEDLYRRAIALDPWLGMAYTNLGNVKFRQGHTDEALGLYQKALALDSHQPEAQYNVGYVLLERGQPAAALPHLEASVRGDGTFADAYFYLAMAYESVGQSERAAPHWLRYLALEPEGPWAEIARRHLEEG